MLRCRLLPLLTAALLLFGASSAHAASAALDTTFGSSGQTTIDLNGGWSYDNGDAIRTSDDRIVLAGVEANYGLAIARLTANGALDSSFDSDGITTDFVSGADSTYPRVGGVAVDGSNNTYVSVTLTPQGASAVYKYTSAGQRDPNFGSGGVVTLHTMDGTVGGLRLNPAGTQLLVADVGGASHCFIEVHALDPSSGAPVTSFGSNGVATIVSIDPVDVNDLIVRPTDGKIIVGGDVLEHGTTSDFTMMVARFTAGGQGDTSFGSGGIARPFALASAHLSSAMDLFSVNSTTYAVGQGDNYQSMAIAALNDSGGLDSAFGGGLVTDYAPNTGGLWNGANVQGDGGVVVTGGRYDTSGNPSTLTRRYTASGQIDSTFGDGGTVTLPGDRPAVALVAQPSTSRYVTFSTRPVSGKEQAVITGIKPNLAPPTTSTPTPTPSQPSSPNTGGSNPAPPSSPSQPAEPPVPAGCTRSVTVGPLEIKGSCLERDGMTWVSTASATVGGLKFVPNGAAAKLIIDPLNLRIAAKGQASIVLQASAFGRTLGPVTIYKGAFDWTWQYRPDLSFLSSFVMPQGGKAISLGTLGNLPGLGGVGSLPRIPDLGFPDFSKLSAANVAKLAGKIPSLRTQDVSIPLSLLGINSLPELNFRLPSGNSLFGFQLAGDIGLKMGERSGVKGVDVAVNMKLPPNLGSIAGSGRFFVGVNGSVVLDALGFNAPEVWFPGQIVAKPVQLSYDGPANTWSGATALQLGFTANDTKLGGSWLIVDGRLKKIGVVTGGIPLGSVVTIDDLQANLTLDPTRLYGSVALGAGPNVSFLGGRIVGINGTFDFNGDFADITGSVNVANTNLAKAEIKYWWDGTFYASGDIKYFIDDANQYGFRGHVEGNASKSGFNVEGNLRFQAGSKFLDGSGIVSSKGVAGCATIQGFLWQNLHLGAGYKWGAKWIDWLGGACDFAAYRAKISANAAAPAYNIPATVQVAAGQKAVSFKVEGDGSQTPPRFTLTGPGGLSVTTPADGSTVMNDHFVVIQQPADGSTYVAVAKPPKGAWTFTPAKDTALGKISSAGLLPKPKVTGRVKNGRLLYAVEPVDGQTVHFVEEGGKRFAAELGDAKGRKGALAVARNAGPGGTRQIVALVEYNGLVRARIVVAKYKASGKALAAPRVVVKRNRKHQVTTAWTPVPGAAGYRALVSIDGALTQRSFSASTRKFVLPSVPTLGKATVTVQALGGPTRIGKAGHGALRTPKAHKRTGKVPGKRKARKKS